MHTRIVGVLLALLVLSIPAMGAQSFLGSFSGNIITPDAIIAPVGTWELSFHDFIEVLGGGEDLITVGAIYGLTPNLEVGVSFLNNDQSDLALSGKLRLVEETAERPTVIVGVFDVAGTADMLQGDPSFYVAVSKNVTPIATDIVGQPSRPLRLTLGFGSGIFDGLFAGLDWTLQERLSLMVEYLNQGFQDDSEINAGFRYALSDAFRLDAATIDFEDFAFGLTFTSRFQ